MDKRMTIGWIGVFVIVLAGLLSISMVSAEVQTLGTYKQYDCVNVRQICANCTYVNYTSIVYPNSTNAASSLATTKADTEYTYEFCATSQLTDYIVNYKADPNGLETTGNFDFNITTTGNDWWFSLSLVLVFAAIISLAFGYTFENAYFGFISGTMFMLWGVFTWIYGFNDFANLYTQGIGTVGLGFGLYFMIVSAYEWTLDTTFGGSSEE